MAVFLGYAARRRKRGHKTAPEVTYNNGELDLSFRLEETRFSYERGLRQYVWRANIWGCPEQHSQSDFTDGIWLTSEDDLP